VTRLLGKGEGHTVVILTGEESALIRRVLEEGPVVPDDQLQEAERAFNRGVARGTERIKGEFAELQAEQKARKKT
jgi:hypothetical protein